MLNRFLSLQKQALCACMLNFRRQPILSLITSLMIGFILTWPTFLWVLSNQAKDAIQQWQNNAYFSFYLPSSLASQDREDVFMRLRALPHIKTLEVLEPKVVLDKLLKHRDRKQIEALGVKNPLPYVIEVTPDIKFTNAQEINLFYQSIASLPYIHGSKNDFNWFQRLSALEQFLSHFSMLILGILMLGVAFLVSNTLRMVIHARHEEIQILKLVGASMHYILGPFLYAGVFYGAIGAIVAIFSVDIVLNLLQDNFNSLAELYHHMGALPLMGFTDIFGFFESYWAWVVISLDFCAILFERY